MNVLIVCHAGAQVGLGHLTRSLVAARAIREDLNADAYLLVQGDSIQRADLDEFEHHFLGGKEDLLYAMRQQVSRLDVQVVILDLHPSLVPEDIGGLLENLRQDSCKIISVDGLVNYREKVDLVFIPSFHFSPPEDFAGATPILYGWDCFLLDVKHRVTARKPGRQVLALTGGSDTTGLGRTLPTLLNAALPAGTVLHWVTGPYAQQPVFPVPPRFSMLNHQSPSGLEELMTGSNYAVTVYGVSFFELLYFGVPTVVFSPYGNKNDTELAAIGAEGVALVANDEREAVAKLKNLMADDSLAALLSRRARQKLSVAGGHRFAQAVARLMA